MTDIDEQKSEQPAEAPAARYLNPREMMVPLEHPFELGGKVWTEIKVRRVTGKEVSAYFDKLRDGDSDAVAPMIDCPQEVWDAIDDDDQVTVDKAARPFWPRRLIQALGLTRELGGDTSA